MPRDDRPALGQPTMLLVLAPLVAAGAAVAAVGLGGSRWAVAAAALLVPWALCLLAGLSVVGLALPSRRGKRDPGPPRRAVEPAVREIDLRDWGLRRVPVPRQNRVPADDGGHRGPSAP